MSVATRDAAKPSKSPGKPTNTASAKTRPRSSTDTGALGRTGVQKQQGTASAAPLRPDHTPAGAHGSKAATLRKVKTATGTNNTYDHINPLGSRDRAATLRKDEIPAGSHSNKAATLRKEKVPGRTSAPAHNAYNHINPLGARSDAPLDGNTDAAPAFDAALYEYISDDETGANHTYEVFGKPFNDVGAHSSARNNVYDTGVPSASGKRSAAGNNVYDTGVPSASGKRSAAGNNVYDTGVPTAGKRRTPTAQSKAAQSKAQNNIYDTGIKTVAARSKGKHTINLGEGVSGIDL